MKEIWDFNRAVQVLNREIELLKKISGANANVRQAAINHEWDDFDEKTLEVNNLAGEFAAMEEERENIFSCLAVNDRSDAADADETSFLSLVAALPENEQNELSRLHRELKMEIYKIRALNETFLDYLNEAKTMAAAYISAVCPARGGQLYTRKGRTASPDLRSVVINNRF